MATEFVLKINVDLGAESLKVIREFLMAFSGGPGLSLPAAPTVAPKPEPPWDTSYRNPVAPVVPPAVPTQPLPNPIQAPPVPPAQAVPTTVPTYTQEQLAVAATQLVDANRRQDVVSLLAAYGVQALTQLPKERYGEFATALRGMGAKI